MSLRAAIAAVVLAALVVLTAWVARVYEGRGALSVSDTARRRGDAIDAIVAARAAAEARCPLCGAPELGYARLYAIAKDAEAAGDVATAIAAWRAVRAAALATVVVDAMPARRERADMEIARLEHRADATAVAGGSMSSPAATEERLKVALAASTVPSGTVFVLLALGAALFFTGAARFVRRKVTGWGDAVIALGGGAIAALGLLVF